MKEKLILLAEYLVYDSLGFLITIMIIIPTGLVLLALLGEWSAVKRMLNSAWFPPTVYVLGFLAGALLVSWLKGTL